MLSTRYLVAIFLISFVTPSFAGCDEVYVNNVRNRTFTEDNYSSLNTLYDNLCSSSGSKKSMSLDSSMGVVIDSLPINMTGNGKSTEEKADAFCHTSDPSNDSAEHSTPDPPAGRVESFFGSRKPPCFWPSSSR
jgi:hypothetical protein